MKPIECISAMSSYAPARHSAPIDLKLDAGEARGSLESRYPDARALEAAIAARHRLDPSQVIVTAGADDALDRACRALLNAGTEMVMPVPTFEMLGRYARLTGTTVREVPWPDGAYPTNEVLAAVTPETRIIAVVSPNNPTGAVACAANLERLAREAPHALLLVDLAYVEFADEDLTDVALSLPNALVTRTLSKAWGLAGLRVGYALGPARIVDWLRRTGHPYPVASPSLALAERCIGDDEPMRARVALMRRERQVLRDLLEELGVRASKSQANFVLARTGAWLRDALAGLGIGVRLLEPYGVRISCPGDEESFTRLMHGIETALSPEALLFDMDGVLADVSRSYRRAIVETAALFGVTITAADIAAIKIAGDANNDWLVTQRLVEAAGVPASLGDVTARFEAIYADLAADERLIPEPSTLARLAARLPLGIVTGRPRAQAERFLADRGIAELFSALVCMEDAPLKPDPAPVKRALEALGVRRAWLVGDTPDDMQAARAAQVVPIGFGNRLDSSARVLDDLATLEELLP